MGKEIKLIKLTKNEATIVGLYNVMGNASVSEFSAASELPNHKVRYCIDNLRRRGILLNLIPVINSTLIGYRNYSVSVSLQAKGINDDFYDRVKHIRGLAWLARTGGESNQYLEICAPSALEVRARYSIKFSPRMVYLVHDQWPKLHDSLFSRKYLLAKRGLHAIRVEYSDISSLADDADRRLLAALCTGCYQNEHKLSVEAGIPASTLHRRIRRLEESGIIAGYIGRVNTEVLNLHRYKFRLSFHGLAPETWEKARRFAESHPLVVSSMECVGSWDMDLNIEAATSGDLPRFQEELSQELAAHIATVQSFPVYDFRPYLSFPFPAKRQPA